jgi:tetratricopeptide (TPR) repeat protein
MDDFEQLMADAFDRFYYGKWEESDLLCEQARRLRPDSGRPSVIQGRSRMMQGQLAEARDKFAEALEAEPDSVQAWEALSSMFAIHCGDHETAVHCLLYSLQHAPDRQRTWRLLLMELERLHTPDLLREVIASAQMRADGDTESAFDLRCAIYKATGQSEAFAAEARRWVESFPESKMAAMLALMAARPDDEDDIDEDLGDLPEPESDDEAACQALIVDYAESFRVGEDTRQEIADLWGQFLDRMLNAPEV